MELPANFLRDLATDTSDELVQTILTAGEMRIERIVSHGHASPEGFWYDQDENEWVLLLQGAARLRIEGEEPLEMTAGSFINIPARQKHRVEWTHAEQKTIWLAIHHS